MMSELTFEHFNEFFQQLWGWPPFAWQRNLAKRVLENASKPWPDAIALPTASGKTACIDIAVYALAAGTYQNHTTARSNAPRRVFFVVDRRIIVDEAFERARQLAQKLLNAKHGILSVVADRLRKVAGGSIPLMCFQLRGGMYRSDAWARSPLQPSIVASTVDQVGSRLLFRAYGRSPKAWPIQAGLVGNDALILLDEAHCSRPFMETLQAVEKYRQWAEEPLSSPFHVSILSATPPEVPDIFCDESKEPRLKGHPLGDRQLAQKIATLKKRSVKEGKDPQKELAKGLAQEADHLVNGRPLAAIVFANYVATAREVHRLLAEKYGDRAILLTGRMRPIDKDDTVLERLKTLDLSSAHSKNRQMDAPVFVIATQTLEVGADLDFDVLVTECASLDALRQRFGRLNRMGRDISASAIIMIRADQARKSTEDPVYGESLAHTWNWLTKHADKEKKVDLGIASLAEKLLSGAELAELNTQEDHSPVMLPAHVDCWAQTWPEPLPTPDVSVFLHGPGRASADVQICWRADIDLSSDELAEKSLDAIAFCPPATPECLPVPIWVLRRWMRSEESLPDSVSDVESASSNNKTTESQASVVRRIVRWCGREEAEIINNPEEIRAGDVIVIPAPEEGWESLGDLPHSSDSALVLDWGDRAYAKAHSKFLLRLHPDVVSAWPSSASKSRCRGLANNAQTLYNEDFDSLVAFLKETLSSISSDDTAPPWLREIASGLLSERSALKRMIIPHPLGTGVILKGFNRFDPKKDDSVSDETDWFSDEDDADSSGTTYVPLAAHLKGVAALAQRFSEGCQFPPPIVQSLACAGWLHDAGKADPRFQALLRGGNPWARGELLAKSQDMPHGRSAYERARRTVAYPQGGRHELLSIRLAESSPDVVPTDAVLRDLVIYLIQTHHGYCRPFAPAVNDPAPVEVLLDINGTRLCASSKTDLERLDSGVPDRFWRLVRRYGWWGLAWMECIFRLADHRRSKHEEQVRRISDE